MKGAALLLLGLGLGWGGQQLERIADRVTWSAIAADNLALRKDGKVLRQRCPSRSRYQLAPFKPGRTI